MSLRTSLARGFDRRREKPARSIDGCTRGCTGRRGILALLVLSGSLVSFTAQAQDAVMSTSVAPGGSGATSRISLDTVTAKPATDRGLTLPAFSLIDDGTGPRLNSLMLQMPTVDFGDVTVTSVLGDQRLPAVFRSGTFAGPALASATRGLTLTTSGRAPWSLSFGQLTLPGQSKTADVPTFAAAAVSFTPSKRLSVTPQLMIPSGAANAQASIGTAIRANLVKNVQMLTDLGMASTGDSPWSPLASARLVGQWPRAGIETSVLRGTAAPATGANTAFVSSRDREAVQAHVQPMRGLALAALTSVSRPSSEPAADDTTQGTLRIAYDKIPNGQLAATQQREATASREVDTTSLEWQHKGAVPMTIRYVRQNSSDSALESNNSTSRFEVDLPVLAPGSPGTVDVRAALTAGTISGTASGISSKLSGRIALVDKTALSGETELGITNQDGQLLRGLRLSTEMPVVPTTRLQISYVYRTGTQFPLGQVFEARILRSVSFGR